MQSSEKFNGSDPRAKSLMEEYGIAGTIGAETWGEFIDKLKKLKERMTPKKVKDRQQVKGYLIKGRCPNCNIDRVNATNEEKLYCEKCGQLIDWSE